MSYVIWLATTHSNTIASKRAWETRRLDAAVHDPALTPKVSSELDSLGLELPPLDSLLILGAVELVPTSRFDGMSVLPKCAKEQYDMWESLTEKPLLHQLLLFEVRRAQRFATPQNWKRVPRQRA